MYCSGLPVVAARAELNSFKKPGRSLIFSFATLVSILMFGILCCWNSLCKVNIHQMSRFIIKSAPSKRGRYWEIHPRCPRDFLRPERCPEGAARGTRSVLSVGSALSMLSSGQYLYDCTTCTLHNFYLFKRIFRQIFSLVYKKLHNRHPILANIAL